MREEIIMKKRYLLKDENGVSGILETIVSVGISITLLTVFFYSTDTLYTVQDEPGTDLEAKSVGLMEKLINDPGQDHLCYPEWQEFDYNHIVALGLGTSRVIQYGVMKVALDFDTQIPPETVILDGPYSQSPTGTVPTCFLAGTKIVMADESYKNIEDIEVGDLVKSYDEENNKIVDKKVTQVFHHEPEEMSNYYLIINNQLRVTPNHEFYIDGRWIYADELSIGDNLFYPSSDYEVFSIEKVFEKTYTYNFEVEGNHNYFVAMDPTNSALVHNIPPDPTCMCDTNAASFTWDPWDDPEDPNDWNPYTHEPITFDASASFGTYGGSIVNYEWDFNNDMIYEVSTTEAIYELTDGFETAGSHMVRLKVEEESPPCPESCSCKCSGSEYVNVQEGPFPLDNYIVASTNPVPPIEGVTPLTVAFICKLDYWTFNEHDWDEPYDFTWEIKIGLETVHTETIPNVWNWHQDQEITYTFQPPNGDVPVIYRAFLTVTSGHGWQETLSSVQVGGDILVWPLPVGYFDPIAHFIWYDKDGPYDPTGGTTICLDAEPAYFLGGPFPETYEWRDWNNFVFSTEETAEIMLPDDDNEYKITLKFTDTYNKVDTEYEYTQANKPDLIESDGKPWVLTGKAIWPDSDDETFSSYKADYYVKYERLGNLDEYTEFRADSGVYLYELKDKASGDQPILDYHKIEKLDDPGSRYMLMYNNIKSGLGLVSDEILYNFRIEIDIPDDPIGDGNYVYGREFPDDVPKELLTRQVLVYYNATAEKQGVDWVIKDHPVYKAAEITLYIFLGGEPP